MNGAQQTDTPAEKPSQGATASPAPANGNSAINKKRKKDGLKPIITTEGPGSAMGPIIPHGRGNRKPRAMCAFAATSHNTVAWVSRSLVTARTRGAGLQIFVVPLAPVSSRVGILPRANPRIHFPFPPSFYCPLPISPPRQGLR
ncbi:hypothetical protein N658DRAFT_310455 [Parathielavia hyrcaniae]|uniref:Uncharacterized protein n=1 Tax=Parathielavia hyrcaniae TaxID=113614 RepID=A0AAN6Q9G6_9PEZI|nr:hypothetical protein N658DRAFT_310455 [Parathielavia hyrcaniae]